MPNVSLCKQENEVHYNPIETRVVAKYNVTDASNPTLIISDASNFVSIEIDGVVQQSVVNEYTFSTIGEHTVKCTLTDPTSIEPGVFRSCDSLTSIYIPNSVTSIGFRAFFYCNKLTSIVSNATIAPTIDVLTFVNVGSDGTLTVPAGSTGYDVWMSTDNLGQYGWTKVEQ